MLVVSTCVACAGVRAEPILPASTMIEVVNTPCGASGATLRVMRSELTVAQAEVAIPGVRGAMSACWYRVMQAADASTIAQDNHPVTCVSQAEVRFAAIRLSEIAHARISGRSLRGKFRLPTSQEWSCFSGAAPRPDSTCASGNVLDQAFATKFHQPQGAYSCDDGEATLGRADGGPQNAFGLYGVWGGAEEWLEDADTYAGGSFLSPIGFELSYIHRALPMNVRSVEIGVRYAFEPSQDGP